MASRWKQRAVEVPNVREGRERGIQAPKSGRGDRHRVRFCACGARVEVPTSGPRRFAVVCARCWWQPELPL